MKIGVLSYVSAGYGTPQIEYLIHSLRKEYSKDVPVYVFAPRFDHYENFECGYPDYLTCAFDTIDLRRVNLGNILPKILEIVEIGRFERIYLYGAGTHTRNILEMIPENIKRKISGIIVSKKSDDSFCGYSVFDVSEVSIDRNNSLVLLSSECFEEQMYTILQKEHHGANCISIYNPAYSKLPATVVENYRRLYQTFHICKHEKASLWIDSIKPDILVMTHFQFARAIYQANHKPKMILNYVFETPGGIDVEGLKAGDVESINRIGAMVGVSLFPEKNRVSKYFEIFSNDHSPVELIYNVQRKEDYCISKSSGRSERKKTILVQGSISHGLNGLEFLPDIETQFNFDIYGRVYRSPLTEELLDSFKKTKNIRIKSLVSRDQLKNIRNTCAYLWVYWNPDLSSNTYYACPNKFFEAIASGVPPIAAPHPQCVEFIEKYKCGILMEDWSTAALQKAVKRAEAVFESEDYWEMVENCRIAFIKELNWETQFKKISKYFKSLSTVEDNDSNEKPKLVIVDHSLRNEIGHHYHYAKNVLSAAKEDFFTILACHQQLEVSLGEADLLLPIFRYDFWGIDPLSNTHDIPRASVDFKNKLKSILSNLSLKEGDIVFIPNISDSDLRTLSEVDLKNLIGKSLLRIFVRHELQDGSDRLLSLSRIHNSLKSVQYVSDTKEICEQHERLLNIPFKLIPIPVSIEPNEAMDDGPQTSNCIRVAYLGDAREEKGFQLLPELVESFLQNNIKDRVVFEFQTNSNGGESSVMKACVRLRELAEKHKIILHEKALSQKEYYALLKRSDIILALYDQKRYFYRSSHVVNEALCSGKELIVTADTSPANQLEQNCKWIVSDRHRPHEALQWMIENRNESREIASNFQRRFSAICTGQQLVEDLKSNK